MQCNSFIWQKNFEAICKVKTDVRFILNWSDTFRNDYQNEREFLNSPAGFGVSKNALRAGVMTLSYESENRIDFEDFWQSSRNSNYLYPFMERFISVTSKMTWSKRLKLNFLP